MSANERQAQKAGTSPDQIAHFRQRFNDPAEVFARHILICQQDELEQQIAERQRTLETVSAEDLRKTQGEISGLRLAIAKISLKP